MLFCFVVATFFSAFLIAIHIFRSFVIPDTSLFSFFFLTLFLMSCFCATQMNWFTRARLLGNGEMNAGRCFYCWWKNEFRALKLSLLFENGVCQISTETIYDRGKRVLVNEKSFYGCLFFFIWKPFDIDYSISLLI